MSSLIPTKNKQPTDNFSSEVPLDPNEDSSDKKIQYVPFDVIVANPWQPRTNFDRDKLEELAESIKKHGVLQPLIVTKEGGHYQLIAGERRWRALELLQLKEAPVIIKDVSDRDKLELSIIENIQRQDLNPIEEAGSYKRLMEEFGLSQSEIAEQVGKSVAVISNALRFLKLPIVIKEALGEGKINISHAKIILSYPTKIEQIKIFKKIIKNDLTIQQLYEIVGKRSPKLSSKEKEPDPVLVSWEDKISKNLGAEAKIDKTGEKGVIKIKFFSHEELKNILDKLT